MAEDTPKTKVRRPDPVQFEEQAPAVVSAKPEAPAAPVLQSAPVDPNEAIKRFLPVRVDGNGLIAKDGTQIAIVGKPGRMAETGPAIAEAIAAKLNS